MASLAGTSVGKIGLGLMGLTWREDPPPDDQSFSAMKAALDSGATFWNGGEFYGPRGANSLTLLNRYLSKYPEDASKFVLSVKGGMGEGARPAPDSRPENIRKCVDKSIEELGGKKKIDMYESARVDPNIPIEVPMRTLAELVKEGKLGSISLSECSADSIRRAVKIHRVDAVEVEFSMFSPEILENGVAQACKENNITVIAYSPLGRGILTGQIKSPNDIPAGDIRHHLPRFQPENFDNNLKLVEEVEKIAKRKGCTPGQVAIAWILSYNGRAGMPQIIPIPGASSADRVKENCKVVTLSKEEAEEIDQIVKNVPISGDRYGGPLAALMYGDSPPEQ